MYDLQIVTHCYAKSLPQYATHLRLQLATLFHQKPICRVAVTVFYDPSDQNTVRVLESVGPIVSERYELFSVPLKPERLFRRAIGRNIVAKNPLGRVVWFTDVDYMPGECTCDNIASEVGPNDTCTSAGYYISVNHDAGDLVTDQAAKTEGLPTFDTNLFVYRRNRIAIGGIQMVGGELLKRIGYLHGTKWVEPVDPKNGFLSCKCDVKFRRLNKLSFTPIPTGMLFRIRHNEDGRDYDLEGEKTL